MLYRTFLRYPGQTPGKMNESCSVSADTAEEAADKRVGMLDYPFRFSSVAVTNGYDGIWLFNIRRQPRAYILRPLVEQQLADG